MVELPNDWNTTTLGELVDSGVLTMKAGYAEGSHNEMGNGIPHLRPFNVSEDGAIDMTRVKYISPPDGDSAHWLQPGDIVFNNTNSEELTGKTAYFDLDLAVTASNHMTIIRVTDSEVVDSYWLSRYLHHLWRTGAFRLLLRRYVGQATVSLTRLKGLEIPLPAIEEQRAIAHVLHSVRSAKERTQHKVGALEQLFLSLLQELMIGQRRLKGPAAPS